MDSSFAHLVDKCVANFRIPLGENDHVSSVIKLSWIRQIRDTEALDTPKSVLHYVRCHIFCLIGTTLFPDKSTSMMSCKYLPLLRNFAEKSVLTIGDRHSLCRTSRYDTKEMEGPLVLLYVWAWERIPWLAPIPAPILAGGVFLLARRWNNWRKR
ncbi:hypothetical protein Ahy_B08g090318 [Arachis hypogaea]|uniref:Aminotransferase-like plant mobile domain-containing protein n=1 Tax=Arachis hypogaea TaxID=3818 RepID=A0A444XZZ8_ARAHY|nr:hypothetical protein Ahy_B08g090318 [Arachis hypogaea]